MPRSRVHLFGWVAALALFALPAGAQQGPVLNPRIPPPPPEQPASPPAPEKPAPPPTSTPQPIEPKKIEPALPRAVPATVVLPAGTRIRVVLDTPMSTRISRTGQQVVFRTEHPVALAAARHGGQARRGGLELPPNTAFIGSVVKVQRPGSFGKQGEIRVAVDQLQLSTGQTATIEARLDSADPGYAGKGGSDTSRAANIVNLALWTAQGAVLGANIHGGSGAAVGAGAGVLVGLIIMAAHHGQDVYLEPGTPFSVVLQQPVSLPGAAVLAAEENYRHGQPATAGGSSVAAGNGAGAMAPATAGRPAAGSTPSGTTIDDRDMPRLKRRPPETAPRP